MHAHIHIDIYRYSIGIYIYMNHLRVCEDEVLSDSTESAGERLGENASINSVWCMAYKGGSGGEG